MESVESTLHKDKPTLIQSRSSGKPAANFSGFGIIFTHFARRRAACAHREADAA
jgi:hypothetical protein